MMYTSEHLLLWVQAVADSDSGECKCGGSGYMLSPVDTWERCPFHWRAGQPHPEDCEQGGRRDYDPPALSDSGWRVSYDPKPVPRVGPWDYYHDDYDGAPDSHDNRHGCSWTLADALEEIAEYEEEARLDKILKRSYI